MDKLQNALDKMLEVLSSLAGVMNAEQEQLSAGQINSSLLQRITEDKSSLLATLSFLEQMRRDAEKNAGLYEPYSRHPELAQRWTAIQANTLKLRDTNTHNGMLLNHQIKHNEQALQVLKPYHSQKFYGPDGQAISARSVSRKA
ncbi:flagellar export chaperone FlgN [Erwinia pyrifoliae]|uniref:Flagellar export chaperone FlgN n=1 Tax=Erwinia pyrifoliae TaxID=79967 RepID=A0ABY5X3Y3_ERWPY|nr:flagellar export chaperone FlgN [Erwinia pyrifoliae]UWS30714.1 flagellar export chaperone FlgN [Erwinia pyrifoliae]UWS32061.1 flagellar export chaperone FlgN [Erwinia pyrifoliae]UXK13727.1 flagellar export chaperone FlgN [Erwinia pyrifoliae]CAX55949.1 Flagellar biosynthesis protein [Erwinia pyrifoliae Ep1/96]CAY74716.1 Flagella synthesis protein flgN [Erwinia pyrifoliae DSM 12163]